MAEKLETKTKRDFVVVCASEAENAERIRLPANIDGSLCAQTLKRAFPHANGLKYKNPSTGAYRALLMDTSVNVFYKPECGWHNKLFIVISSQPLLASSTLQSTSDTNNKGETENIAFVPNPEPTTPKSTTSSSVDVSNTVPFESSTISTAAKKTQAYVSIPFHDDEDEALLSSSENSGDKRLRQSGDRAGFSKNTAPSSGTASNQSNPFARGRSSNLYSNNYPQEHLNNYNELKNKLLEIDLKIDDLKTKVEILLKNTDSKTANFNAFMGYLVTLFSVYLQNIHNFALYIITDYIFYYFMILIRFFF